ncbi:MAG: CDP-glycerol glycerophosphotransferase family protein [Moraxellaceae bacterium]|nr:CDP-glycerol glycerophosphotransferase family protein [Moraxellaceae bacterium]
MLASIIFKYLKFFIYKVARVLSYYPIFNNTVVVLSGGGFGNSINGKANYDFLKSRLNKNTVVLIAGKNDANTISLKSIKGIIYLHFSKKIITDNGIPFSVNLKNKIVVQTWHGIPIKKIGLNDQSLLARFGYLELQAMRHQWADTTAVICLGEHVRTLMMQAFDVSYKQTVISHSPYMQKVLQIGGIEKLEKKGEIEKIFYLPTYRDWVTDRSWDLLEDNNFIEFFVKKNITVYYKYHPLDADAMLKLLPSNFIKVDGDYVELLKECDCFITDYSSAFFDALLLDIPVFFYAVDYENYKKERGIYDEELYELICRLDGLKDEAEIEAAFVQAHIVGLTKIKDKYLPKLSVDSSAKKIIAYFE